AALVITNTSLTEAYTINLAGATYRFGTNSGPYDGGNTLTITNGADFGAITNVLVGGTGILPVASGSNWVTIILPSADAAGVVDVVIQTSDNGDYVLADAYTYNPRGEIGSPAVAAWRALDSGLNASVYALAHDGANLYAAGLFTEAGGAAANHVASWDGVAWTSLAAGLDGQVNALTYEGTTLYAGGNFTYSGASYISRAAVWDGTAWTNLGAGLRDSVWALAHDGANLYAGGSFTSSGWSSNEVQVSRVAMWDGSVWTNLGAGVNSAVYDLAHDGSNLYAGGQFTMAGGATANRVAMWNGSAWTNLGSGVNGTVWALLHDGSNLYAGGNFTTVGGASANRVAMWNGSGWTSLGSGLSNSVYALAHDGTNLYVGGSFTNASGLSTRCVAKWNGSSWTNMDSGMGGLGSPLVRALACQGTNIYAGGDFTEASGMAVTNMARWFVASATAGVTPASGSYTGGFQVVIYGQNLGSGSDITNVTICGAAVAGIVSQSATQVIVTAGVGIAGGLGDVRVYSVSFGETVKSNAFMYNGPGCRILGVNGQAVASGEAVSSGKGTRFHSLLAGASQTNTFAVTNNGTEEMTIYGWVTNGAGSSAFLVSLSAFSLPVGAVSNFTVTYTAAALGHDTCALVISNNTPSGVFTLNLAGSCLAVSTNIGPYGGGNTVTFTNGSFGTITNILVGGITAVIEDFGISWFTITMPSIGTAGTVDVVVQTSDDGDATLENAYTYNPAGSIGGTTYDWTQWEVMPGLPQARYYPGGDVLDGKMYVVGGNDAENNAVTNVYMFDGASWTDVAGLPQALRESAVVTYNGALYSIGGYTGASRVTNVYKFNGTTWTEVAGLPASRFSLGAEVLGGNLIAYGGRDSGGALTNVFSFDGSSWTEITGMNPGKFSMGYAAYSGKVYSVAGYTLTSATYEFDGSNWSTVSNYPVSSGCAVLAGATLDGYMYMYGGQNFSAGLTNAFRYDGNAWNEIVGLPTAMSSLGASAYDGSVYAFGGREGSTALTNVYRYPGQVTSAGILPSSGPWTGGYPVVISGVNLGNGADITNVTLCGVAVTSIDSQNATQVVVTAAAGTPGLGDARVYSVGYGVSIKSNAFTYTAPVLGVLGTNGAPIASDEAANAAKGSSFGLLPVGADPEHSLTITNSGDLTLSIAAFTSTVPEFSLSPSLFGSISPGGKSALTVLYTPTNPGDHSVTIIMTNNGADSPFLLNLSGSCYDVSPWSGPVEGGNLITVFLGNSGDITNVLIGSVSVIPMLSDTNGFTLTLPAASTNGDVTITVQTSGHGEIILEDAYRYNPRGEIGNSGVVYNWEAVAGLPTGVWRHASVTYDDKIYVMGGRTAVSGYIGITNSVYCFDGTNWTDAPSMPTSRYAFAATVCDGLIYAIGGMTTNDMTFATNVFVFNGANWSETTGLPRATASLSAGTLDDGIHIAGGEYMAWSAVTNAYRYDGTNWMAEAGLPSPRLGMASGVRGNELLVTAGYYNSNCRNSTWSFAAGSWSTLPNCLNALLRPAGAVMDDTLYVLGGNNGAAQNFAYTLTGTNWNTIHYLPLRLDGLSASVLGGQVYAIGGCYTTIGTYTNVYRYPTFWFDPGVAPLSGSWTGGYQVAINGRNLCNGELSDVTNVTICGVTATVTGVAGATQIVVTAGASITGGVLGDVRVYSSSYGETVRSNVFTYAGSGIAVSGPSFGHVALGAVVTNIFTVTNTGTEALLITAATNDGAGATYFDVSAFTNRIIDPGASDTVPVKFTASAAGVFTPTGHAINNSPIPDYSFGLTGSVYSASTNVGPCAGGNTVTFTNGNFGAITNVLVGGVNATITGSGTSWFTITMPPIGTNGTVDVVAQSSDHGDTVLAGAYTYNPGGWIIDHERFIDWTRWMEVEGMPAGRRYLNSDVLDGSLYAVGGSDYNGITHSNVYAYDGTNWTETASLPKTNKLAAVGTLSNTLYSIGGNAGGNSSICSNVYAFNGMSWTELPGMPTRRDKMGSAVYDGRIYMAGGTLGGMTFTNMYVYDGANFTQAAGLPMALDVVQMESLSGYMYCFGGGVTNVYRYDGAGWMQDVGLPGALTYLGSAVLDGKIYAIGGTVGGVVQSAVYSFDGTNWAAAPSLPAARAWLTANTLGDYIYAIGGGSGGGVQLAKTNVYVYPAYEDAYGVCPSGGSWTGNYPVVITGTNLGNGADITNVTICGVSATVVSQAVNRVWVSAGAITNGVAGDVVVYSVSFGETLKTNAFTYLMPMFVLSGTNGSLIANSNMTTSADGTDFGAIIVGQGMLTNVFSITNNGNAALTISGISTNGSSAFTLELTSSVVAASAAIQLPVVFTPRGGPQNAAFGFTHDGTNSPFVLNVTGFGLGGGIALSTTDLAFTATYQGTNPAPLTLDMSNVGLSSFTYTNEPSVTWLSLQPDSGSLATNAMVSLTNYIDVSGVNAGAYIATNLIQSADATNAPRAIVISLSVAKADQVITFSHPGPQETTNVVAIAPTATSGLTVDVSVVSGPGLLTSPTSPTSLTFTNEGAVIITASQAGNSNWNTAASITHTIVVSKAVAPVTINNLSQVYDGTARSVTASTTPGGLTVNFTYEGNTWAPTNAGSYAVTGVVSDIMYQGWKTGTLVVAKADQTITFPAIASQTYTSRFGLAATAGSGFAVSFAVSEGPGSIADDTNLTFTATGAVSIVASQAGDANWNAAPPVTNGFMVNKADQVITFPAIADQETTNVTPISATALSALGVTFSVVSGPASLTGPTSPTSLTYTNAGAVAIAAHQPGSNYWNAAPSVTNTFNVIKAIGAVMLSDLTQVYDGTPKYPTDQTDPSNLTVVLTFDGSTNLPVNVGAYEVIGTMDDPIYQSAATDTFTIVQATQAIVFAQLPDMIITDAWGLSATGGASTNPITFAVLSGPAGIAGGTNLTFTNVGEVLITANQAGDSNYLAAITLTNVFNVSPTTPEISTPTVSNILAQTATLGGTIDSTNGTPVTERGVIWWTDRSTNIYSASEAGAFGTGAYSLNVTGIVAGITNFFEAYAVNVSGTVYSTTSEFLARPDAPEVLAPTNIQATSFYANWNAAEGALTYYLDVSETNTFDSYVPGYENLALGDTTSASVTGLGATVWYYYRVRAENAQGLSTNSATRTVGLMMDLVIAGVPVEHDTPTPLDYGTHRIIVETMTTNSVTTPADESNGVRYACTGWTGTGDVPTNGTTNTVTFLFTTDSTLTWQWKTQYLLTQESTGGYVYGLVSGWKDQGWIFDLTARPTNGYLFAHWLTNGSYAGDADVFRVLADAPKQISAIFAPTAWDVNVTGTTDRTDWEIIGANAFGIFEVCNPSDSDTLYLDKFLFAITPNANMHIRYPDGTSPAGQEYVDVTADVEAKLAFVSNGDAVMDPGECVTLDPIEFLGKNPAFLDPWFYAKGMPDMAGVDTDGDGIPNTWEDQEGLNPNNPLDGGEDQDEDGVPSEQEYIADTNPFDATSYLHIRAMNLIPGAQQVEWIGGSSVVQYLEWNPDMSGNAWSIIMTNTPPTPVTNLYDDSFLGIEGYYRIRVIR
ncbi:MAG: choice-of-anchor D domain-containing protein, partial [Spartobacteria bacterium]|nr:choice-of-anchor D domain-containing protein [Spartobacteria bacterium]